jgi:hypothetical protein
MQKHTRRSDLMARNRYKERFQAMPVEKHDTAAWANIEGQNPSSQVTYPNEIQVRNAKEYVDTNEK